MKTHTELLNYLATKHNLKSYLEIGVQNPANNFDKIKISCKVGVDPDIEGVEKSDHKSQYSLYPDTSDYYFNKNDVSSRNGNQYIETFDLIFIDGLHHADQVKRDFDNSLRCLNAGGYIVIHDTLPENEAGTIVPRETRQWWGDVYKFAMELSGYVGINFRTVDIDNGCTVVWKDEECQSMPTVHKMNWETFLHYRSFLLDVIQPSEIGNYF